MGSSRLISENPHVLSPIHRQILTCSHYSQHWSYGGEQNRQSLLLRACVQQTGQLLDFGQYFCTWKGYVGWASSPVSQPHQTRSGPLTCPKADNSPLTQRTLLSVCYLPFPVTKALRWLSAPGSCRWNRILVQYQETPPATTMLGQWWLGVPKNLHKSWVCP